MRFVIFGAGAIGGVVGARMSEAGFDVALIARGDHLDAIREHGLTLETPLQRTVFKLPAAADPAALGVGGHGDVVLLATKSQDTAGALASLRASGAYDVPIVCLQNGVENERLALRSFARVYGAVVMLPAAHLEPGRVESYGSLMTGIIDVGGYPAGTDDLCDEICDALAQSDLFSSPRADVMRFKYAKLLLNLGNAVDALCGRGERSDELTALAQAEGRAALTAAGIEYEAGEVDDLEGRWERIGVREIGGRKRAGSSSWQSLTRGTGAIETDYLNGEVVLVGRLHGVPTPVNAALCELAARYASSGAPPGELSVDEVLAVAA
ncbi:MAG: ketopantoate reductase family protein [Solirubrobacteraceae bacterium]